MEITRRAAFLTPLLAGLAAPAISVSAPGRSALRFVPAFDLKGMDPIENTGLVTLQHGYMIYDTLFAMDRSFRPRPQMVKTFEVSADGLTYDFRLRDGLSFHDGTEVTSRDCVASIRRWGARDVMGRMLLARMSDMKALDRDRFEISLSAAFPLLIHALAKISSSPCFIMREREAATDPSVAVTSTIGSGPFLFSPTEFVPGSRVVYTANSAYVPRTDPSDGYAGAKRAAVDRVEWHIMPDPETQVDALRAGEVDILSAPAMDLLPLLRGDPAIEVKRFDQLGWTLYIRPNHLFPPFNDVRARQALAYLVDQPDYMLAGAGDRANWDTCWSFLACGPTTSPVDNEFGKADLPRAQQLMSAAGYTGKPVVVLNAVDNPMLSGITAVTASRLRQIGVAVQLVSVDMATMFAMRASTSSPGAGGWNLFHGLSLGIELENPLTNFPLASPCENSVDDKPTGWFGWPCDPAIEKLRQQWAEAPGEAERARIAMLLQLAASRSLPFIPLGTMYAPVAFRRIVRGLPEMPVSVLWNATTTT